MQAWDIYSSTGEWLDRVWYNNAISAEEVATSLTNHDGFASGIVAEKAP